MAFGIIICEQDEYLCSLIKERLTYKFPEAYIKGMSDRDIRSGLEFVSKIFVFYNDKEFPGESIKPDFECEIHPLFSDDGKGHGIIDINKLSSIINSASFESGEDKIFYRGDRLKLLVSFAYIDERERFITSAMPPSSFDSMHPIRIDLMSGMRMARSYSSSSGAGSLTGLLNSVSSKSFTPESIMRYLGPDIGGFLSPGMPDSADDVFDIGINSCLCLMDNLKKLCASENAGVLVVAEGWRLSELTQLVPYPDSLHILLPARMCTEDTGMTRELGILRRALPPSSNMTVHYCEDFREKEHYEAIRI